MEIIIVILFIATLNKILCLVFFTSTALLSDASASERHILKSFNFKVYYSEGGYDKAKYIITEAENSLEDMENFLGTRLVEQIDIFLSEEPVDFNQKIKLRNGVVLLDNSSIYLNYSGNSKILFLQMKERLAEILINGMLYGNTIKERLKNNREINVPDWYVSGLTKYIASGKESNTSWLADYFEGKLKLNLNLTGKAELALFGQAVFSYINDSFGVNKLRQLLFYTKLSGKTDYAFQYVLNKSLNWVIADWFKMEKARYLLENKERLPNDPEPLSFKLSNAQILEIKFTQDGLGLDLLIKKTNGIEVWNYNLSEQKAKRIIKINDKNDFSRWRFCQTNSNYLVAKSNGRFSELYVINSQDKMQVLSMPFNYILSIKAGITDEIFILGQQNYTIDIFKLRADSNYSLEKVTKNKYEEIDFTIDSSGKLLYTFLDEGSFKIKSATNDNLIYKSSSPINFLSSYDKGFISFLGLEKQKYVGVIVNSFDSSQVFQITNYNRSIKFYDYNGPTHKVMEVLNYQNQNYVVLSQSSFDRVVQTAEEIPIPKFTFGLLDTANNRIYNYKFITGFEHKQAVNSVPISSNYIETKTQPRIREVNVPKVEFKAQTIHIGFSNSQFNSPLFAYFFPIRQGLNNGPNVIIGSEVVDISRKYTFKANIRQPLVGRGTDLDFAFKMKTKQGRTIQEFELALFNSNFQRELYNQDKRFTTREIKVGLKGKLHPKVLFLNQLGYRGDHLIHLSSNFENIQLTPIDLNQVFLLNNLDWLILNTSKLNYLQKLNLNFSLTLFKPIEKIGLNTNFNIHLGYKQIFFRIFHFSTKAIVNSSIGKQKTVWLMGGMSNWLRPIYGNSKVFTEDKVNLYSSMADFEGLPYNYRAGSSAGLLKIRMTLPLNPLLSQQNFNQNFLKFMSVHGLANLGLAWFGKNPFSIKNPENMDVIETGSITITNYSSKNPLLWSYGAGINTILFGYELGFDYAIGFQEKGRIGKFSYFTVGKEF